MTWCPPVRPRCGAALLQKLLLARCYTRGGGAVNGLAQASRAAVGLARLHATTSGADVMRVRWWLVPAAVAAIGVAAPVSLEAQLKPTPALDYGFYKSRVEPIFLKKKAGHTRCVVCHSEGNNMFKLEHLSPGATAWTEDQSRRNF